MANWCKTVGGLKLGLINAQDTTRLFMAERVTIPDNQ
jgi:hypothetical protein